MTGGSDAAVEVTQVARVAAAVPRWLRTVPLYRQLAPHGDSFDRGRDFLTGFRALPIITKREIRREFPRNFLPPGVELESLLDRELIEVERTSGTSEEPTPLLLGSGWWQAQEDAALRLNGWVSRNLPPLARRVTIVSPVCSGEICFTGTPARSERMVGQSLFVNLSRHPFLWGEAALARMVEEALDWQPLFLDVDPVYGVLFARYCERRGVHFGSLRFIISSYEYLSVVHRRILQRVFGVPVFDLYGATETGHLLMENERGEMVPSLETAFLELVRTDPAGVGDLVVTTLSNPFMPLIRYGIGDLARGVPGARQTTFELHGRAQEALRSTRGQRVTVARIDQCFAGLEGFVHYLLRQESPADFTLNYVGEPEQLNPGTLATVQARLAALLGTETGLKLRAWDFLPCENSGKYSLAQPALAAWVSSFRES